MKKSSLLIIISAFIILFVCIMQSGKVIKHIGGPSWDFSRNVKELNEIIKEDKWEEAHKKAEEVEEIFRKKSRWLQISEERDRIDEIFMELARAKAYIYAEDKGGSLSELEEALVNWEHIGG